MDKHEKRQGHAVRAGDWKLIEFCEEGRIELCNLKDDLGEKADLAAKQPKQAKELKAKLAAWRRRADAQMPKLNPDYSKPDSPSAP